MDFLAHRNKNSFTWCLALYLFFFFIYLSIYEYVLRLWNCPAVQQTLSQISVLLNRAVQLIVMISKSHYGEVQYSNQKGLKLGLGNVLIYTNKLKQTVKKMKIANMNNTRTLKLNQLNGIQPLLISLFIPDCLTVTSVQKIKRTLNSYLEKQRSIADQQHPIRTLILICDKTILGACRYTNQDL